MSARVATSTTAPLPAIPLLDAVLEAHAGVLGDDFPGYRNHAYRVANLCAAQTGVSLDRVEKIAIAAAFHDLGIWTDGTFDYLQPSARLAAAYLSHAGHTEWSAEITAMILEHHKLSRYGGPSGWLVEPFRRADWIDVSRGLVTFGMPRTLIRSLTSLWPSAGFHARLVRLELRRLRTHPWSPLPMLRL